MSDTPSANPMGCFNRMVALGIYDPVDKRMADFTQRRTWAVQAWTTAFSVYGFYTMRKAGFFNQLGNTRGVYVAVMAISSVIPGIIMTMSSAGFYTRLDDKYHPLYVDHIIKQAAESN
jgi:hypothetical protein